MINRLSLIGAPLATAVLVALGIASFHEETARSRPVVPPFELFWCEKDDDCTVVKRIGCCPCAQGGAQAAITSWRRDDLRRFLKTACHPEQVCVQLDLCRSYVTARCVDRQCQLVSGDGAVPPNAAGSSAASVMASDDE